MSFQRIPSRASNRFSRHVQTLFHGGYKKRFALDFKANSGVRCRNWWMSGIICASTMSVYAYSICADDVDDSQAANILTYFGRYYHSIMEGEQVDKIEIDFQLFEILALVANYNNPTMTKQLFDEVCKSFNNVNL